MQLDPLELSNRVRSERPVAVVVVKKRSAPSERAVLHFSSAARLVDVDAVTVDVDDRDAAGWLDELRVQHTPEVLLFARGVLLERCAGARDEDDAFALLRAALRKRA